MSGLPGAEHAIVDDRKITDYLLSDSHPAGRSKAAFFRRFGFRPEDWRRLRAAVLEHAQTADVVARVETPFGTKYTLDGPLSAADGRHPRLRAVWFVATGTVSPVLVTAFPAPGERA
ncbi:MAG TPA: hypothetical protein VHA10_01195 [Hypericibacter adhaerens]|uniref:DUF6883 domain-containing protein n=1 Tax=Hypericibacter adhaerens TaxID=2602016 RepID=UPI002BCE51BD|nr:DUF6883 domain-containing protein [Hypericibacter adhaerens]HWA41797.1 hypothetical protein [Hypericibacter adhaerens]